MIEQRITQNTLKIIELENRIYHLENKWKILFFNILQKIYDFLIFLLSFYFYIVEQIIIFLLTILLKK
jgi:hypothetical protein